MTISPTQQHPLLWHEGMLLAPQHFQQNDIYWQHQLCQTMAQLQPYYWGLFELDLNRQELDNGVLEITRLHAVMQDGTHIQVNSQTQPSRLSCPLAENQELKDNRPVTAYLCVPYRLDGAASGQGVVQRYSQVEGDDAVDEASGQGRVPVLRMRPNVQLSLEKLSNNYCLPLLILRRDLNKKPFDITTYHPPLLRIGGGDFQGGRSLRQRMQTLVSNLRGKALQLARSNSGQRQFLYALTASLPPLEVLLQSPGTHPFTLYQALATLLGQTSALTERPVPPRMPEYDHDNPARCFYPLIRHLDNLVAGILVQFRYREFTRRDKTFELQMPAGEAPRELVVELEPAAGQTFANLEEWLDKARIGSEPLLRQLRERRSPGARSERLSDNERFRYNQRGNAMMFRIHNRTLQIDGRDRQAILPGQPLHLVGEMGLAPPARIILYIENAAPLRRTEQPARPKRLEVQ